MKFDLPNLSRYPAPARISAFVVILLLVWAPGAGLIYLSLRNPTAVTVLTLLLLYTEFIFLVRFWGNRVYGQPDLLWRYGLEFSLRSVRRFLLGLAIGTVSLFVLFGTQGILGWVIWSAPTSPFPCIVVEGLAVSLGFGFAEELLFRGWLLDELQRDYRWSLALWIDAIIYAALHGFKLQFPALVLLGLTLGWAKRSSSQQTRDAQRGSLALPMGLHAGLVWSYYLVNVGQLIEYSNRVPEWLTGIDRNPLAGAIGLLFMGALMLTMRQTAKPIGAPRV